MGDIFSADRSEGFPTQHPENKTSAHVDVLEAGIIFAFVILGASLLIILPSSHGRSRFYVLVRIFISIIIGAILLTCNFGYEWESGHVKKASTPYRAGTGHEITANIGLHIGLRAFNVTLTGKADSENGNPLVGEIIDYNEHFPWTWDQGRFGFGPYAGVLQRTFREGQRQGLPLPILWIADYFTIDGEGLRFGRYYRTAGWYTHISMWCAFSCWLLANLFFFSVIRYGAVFTILIGFFQLLSCILWYSIRNVQELKIAIDDSVLATKYSTSFWLTFITGIVCVILGTIILIMDLRLPDETAIFFGVDPLSYYDEYHLTAMEIEQVRKSKGKTQIYDMIEIPSNSEVQQPETQCVLKRRTTIRKVQKALFRKPEVDDDRESLIYLNVPTRRGLPRPPQEN